MSLLIELPQYQRAQKAGALRIAAIIPNPRGVELHFENTRYAPIQVSTGWVSQHMPDVGGYFMVMEDGFDGFRSAAQFDAEYTPVGGDA